MSITTKEAAKFVLGHSGLSSLTPSELKAVVRAEEEKCKPSLLADGIETIDLLMGHFKPDQKIIDEAKALLAAMDELSSGALTPVEKA